MPVAVYESSTIGETPMENGKAGFGTVRERPTTSMTPKSDTVINLQWRKFCGERKIAAGRVERRE